MEILTRFAIKFVRSLRTSDLQTTAKMTLQIINKKNLNDCAVSWGKKEYVHSC